MIKKLVFLVVPAYIILFCYSNVALANVSAGVERQLYEEPLVNGHPGYAVAANISGGKIDKVILIVSGFDTENDDRPEKALDKLKGNLRSELNALEADGWDLMYFEYVDGGIDLKENADNLARFIEFVDGIAETNYHLAVVGGSMGGIVARTMFVQEYSDMGVDTYVSVDSPHHGVTFSNWVDASVAGTLAFYMQQHPAGLQMFNGHYQYYMHYGWLKRVESDGNFLPHVIGPMATCAIALSDGESSWDVGIGDLIAHNRWYPVSSYVDVDGLRSTYMPYHSVVYMDSSAVKISFDWGGYGYRYRDTHSSYFDVKIPNPRDVHAGPDYAILQAIDFVVSAY